MCTLSHFRVVPETDLVNVRSSRAQGVLGLVVCNTTSGLVRCSVAWFFAVDVGPAIGRAGTGFGTHRTERDEDSKHTECGPPHDASALHAPLPLRSKTLGAGFWMSELTAKGFFRCHGGVR